MDDKISKRRKDFFYKCKQKTYSRFAVDCHNLSHIVSNVNKEYRIISFGSNGIMVKTTKKNPLRAILKRNIDV